MELGVSESSGARVVVFDSATVYRERVEGRRTVYLDTNVWIRLSDGKTAEATTLRDVCRSAVQAGRVVFPLSHASFSEMLEHPREGERLAQATLMDELSLGVTVVAPHVAWSLEAETAYHLLMRGQVVPVARSRVFTSVPDTLGEAVLNIPPSCPVPLARGLLDHLRTSTDYRSVRWFAEHLEVDELREYHREGAQRYVREMTDNIAQALPNLSRGPKLDRQKALFWERESMLRRHLVRDISLVTIAEHGLRAPAVLAEMRARLGDGGPERVAQVFSHLPACELLCEVMASFSLNPMRAVRPQDFWDVEHALVAPVYLDAFATGDSGLVDRLGRCRAPVARGCRVLHGLPSLAAYLRELS